MKTIEIRNDELKNILDPFISKLMACDTTKFPFLKADITGDYACSNEYLLHMQGKKVDGFPEKTRGVDLARWIPPTMSDTLKTLDNDLLTWSGSRNNAVKMFYPKQGFMGWHHNANAAGYNILLSWSQKGTGFFRYQDPLSKEIITIHDTPGWTCKVGYYGPWHQPDRIYWHCAHAVEEERFTLGYIIPHEGMWNDMVDDIQSV